MPSSGVFSDVVWGPLTWCSGRGAVTNRVMTGPLETEFWELDGKGTHNLYPWSAALVSSFVLQCSWELPASGSSTRARSTFPTISCMYSPIKTNSFHLRDALQVLSVMDPNAILLLLLFMLLFILLRIVLSVLEISVMSFKESNFNQNFGEKQVKSVLCLIANDS